MSRSNPITSNNPTQNYFEWAGGSDGGYIKSYDKLKQQNVKHDMPFRFLWLDELSKIGGYNPSEKDGYYSNEVRMIGDEELTVRSQSDNSVVEEGLYSDIKDELKAKNARYMTSVYIAYEDNGELVIANITLKGAALSSWLKFKKSNKSNIIDEAVVIDGFEEDKNGATAYRYPTFSIDNATEEEARAAISLDETLQAYLNNDSQEAESSDNENNGKEFDGNFPEDLEDELPF